jgi:hypothetical protein
MKAEASQTLERYGIKVFTCVVINLNTIFLPGALRMSQKLYH